MTGDAVNRQNGGGARSGARTLNLLAAPLNNRILSALREGPTQQADLRHQTGHPAQTTLRAQLTRLHAAGAIEKRRRNRFPGVLEYELSPAGRDLLAVTSALDRWLTASPGGPLELGGGPAKTAAKALTEGWSTTMLHVLAAQPHTLTELDRAIAALNYPSVERRLSALRLAGLVETHEGDGRGTPYGVTVWARRGVAPLVAAIRWERRHAQPAPLGRIEAETLLLLSTPLLEADEGVSGTCRLAMEIPNDGDRRLAGVVVEIENGRVSSCTPRLQGIVGAWALGSPSAWLEAIAAGDVDGIERGGDAQLARRLLASLHRALSGTPAISP